MYNTILIQKKHYFNIILNKIEWIVIMNLVFITFLNIFNQCKKKQLCN